VLEAVIRVDRVRILGSAKTMVGGNNSLKSYDSSFALVNMPKAVYSSLTFDEYSLLIARSKRKK